jgi:hypothetical protein
MNDRERREQGMKYLRNGVRLWAAALGVAAAAAGLNENAKQAVLLITIAVLLVVLSFSLGRAR